MMCCIIIIFLIIHDESVVIKSNDYIHSVKYRLSKVLNYQHCGMHPEIMDFIINVLHV